MKSIVALAVCVSAGLSALVVPAAADPFVDPRSELNEAIGAAPDVTHKPRDPACYGRTLVSTGGVAPRDAGTLVVRWAGQTNFELAYKDSVILLDAWYDRGSLYLPMGFKAADVKKADVMLIGHGHFDHMADAASVVKQTGASVVGAPLTTDKLASQDVDPKLIRSVTGRGGELLTFKNFTVQPILGEHGRPDKRITQVVGDAVNSVAPPLSPEQKAELAPMRARGVSDRRVITEGTIAYLITLDNGFRIYYRDSGGVVTDFEKDVMKTVGRVDLGLLAVSADYLHTMSAQRALDYMNVFHPDVYMPAHHDAPVAGHVPLWRATEPLFQAMKNENPKLTTVSREFREPVCFDTQASIKNGL